VSYPDHYAEVFVEDDGGGPWVSAIKFSCEAAPTAPCRWHPDCDSKNSCDCETWRECDGQCEENCEPTCENRECAGCIEGPCPDFVHDYQRHPYLEGQACWILPWLDSGWVADAEEAYDGNLQPEAQRALIELQLDYGYDEIEGFTWRWAP